MPFLSSADVASLFYLAGYIISRVIWSNVMCDNCCKAVKASNEELASNASYMALLKLKSYKDDCLVACSAVRFGIFFKTESLFRASNVKLVSQKRNIRTRLLEKAKEMCSDIELPTCHNIKTVMLGRFFTLRLRIWAKDERAKLKTLSKNANDGELGSKSMAMRLAVSKFK